MKNFGAQLLLLTIVSFFSDVAFSKVIELETASGFKFHYAQVPEAKKVAIFVAWQTNWAYENDVPAVPYIGVDLMFSGGAGQRNAAEITADFDDLGSSAKLYVSADHIRGSLVTLPENARAAALIAKDVLSNPTLPDDWFQRIKSQFLQNMQRHKARANVQSGSLARAMILGDQSLTTFLDLPVGTLFDSFTVEDIKSWHKSTFTRSNLRVTAAGPIGEDEIASIVDIVVSSLPIGSVLAHSKMDEPVFSGRTVVLVDPKRKQTSITYVGVLPPTRLGNDAQDWVAVSALSSPDNSRLFAAIRNKLRATYSFGASIANFSRESRVIVFSGELEPDKTQDVLHEVRDIYRGFRQSGLSTQEFEVANNWFVNALEANRKKAAPIAYAMMELILDELPPQQALDLIRQIKSYTRDAVNQRIASSFPPLNTMQLVVISPTPLDIEGSCTIKNMTEIASCR